MDSMKSVCRVFDDNGVSYEIVTKYHIKVYDIMDGDVWNLYLPSFKFNKNGGGDKGKGLKDLLKAIGINGGTNRVNVYVGGPEYVIHSPTNVSFTGAGFIRIPIGEFFAINFPRGVTHSVDDDIISIHLVYGGSCMISFQNSVNIIDDEGL